MKLALVSEHASPLAALGGVDAGGQNVYVAALASELAARGHLVEVFTRRDAPDLPDRVHTDGYVVEHVSAGPRSKLPKDELVGHMPAFASHLARRFRRDCFDLVHAHFWMSGMAASAAAASFDLPVVQTFHALGSVKRRHQGLNDTSPSTRIRLEQQLCHEVDHVIATCSDEVRELRRLGLPPGRESVVPCGVDTSLFRPGAPGPTSRTLLSVGRLVERKGVDDVIVALSGVPDADLMVVGGPPAHALAGDPEVQRLQAVARANGVFDRVRFSGALEPAAVARLMTRSAAVVCAPWYEPFGIVPLEAMSCGRPVVGTAVGGLIDSVEDGVCGDLVPARRPDVLADVLRRLLDDAPRRAAYGRAGRARALARFRWDHVAAQVEQVYLDVMATHFAAIAPAGGGA